MKELKSDYISMQQMFMDSYPTLDEIIQYLQELESEINHIQE